MECVIQLILIAFYFKSGMFVCHPISKSPCNRRGFLILQSSPKHQKHFQYLAPSSTSTAIRKTLSPPKIILKNLHPQQSLSHLFFFSTDTFISPTLLPNTSLPIAITDAIGSSKSDCYLVPILWDLIEATIKSKR